MHMTRYAGTARLIKSGTDARHVGMGVAVDRRHVLTCAHVVNDALGRHAESREPPNKGQDKVHVVFPYSASGKPISGGVQIWIPVGTERLNDVAVVEIDEDIPKDVGVPSFSCKQEIHHLDFEVFGATSEDPCGGIVEGRIKGNLPDGTVELSGKHFEDIFIGQGYSGAAVWSTNLHKVVGIVSRKKRDTTVLVAYMIPASLLKQAWPLLPDSNGGETEEVVRSPSWNLQRSDLQRLTDIVKDLPSFSSERDRMPMLQNALGFSDRAKEVVNDIARLEGAPDEVAERVILKLNDFGQLEDGKESLERFLIRAVVPKVDINDAADVYNIFRKYSREPYKLLKTNNPYQLQCGIRLSLTELPAIMHRILKKIDVHFLVVFGTGRHQKSSGHVGLVSDCLYLPEIIASVHKIARQAQMENVEWRSALDIDLLTDLEKGIAGHLGQAHLLLPATGDVNAITGLVMTRYEEQGWPLRPGCSPPFSAEIEGIERRYNAYPAKGFLSLCVNPWNSNALCIVAGGVQSGGTSAALYLLREYLESHVNHEGNNRYNPAVPSKIFRAHHIKYSYHIQDYVDLVPDEDIRNIEHDLVHKWDFLE